MNRTRITRIGRIFTDTKSVCIRVIRAICVLTAITEKPLKEIAEHCYKAEGAESPDEFIQVWKSIHRKKGFVPEQVVFYHEFKPLTDNNGDQNQEINDLLTAKLKHYHHFFKQDVRTGKKLNRLAQDELDKGNKKAAFLEYFTHYCPEYMNDVGKVDSAISLLQSKGELQ